jgi:hypothetical protein
LTSRCETHLSKLRPPLGPTFGEKLGAGGSMDGAVNPTSAEQRGICGVNDRINLQARDISRREVYPLREMRK